MAIQLFPGGPDARGPTTPIGRIGALRGSESLRGMVLDSVASPHSRRNYAKALDDLFASLGRAAPHPRTADGVPGDNGRALPLDGQRPALGRPQDGRRGPQNGMIGAEDAANLTEVPNIPQKGTRLGNWLTREQAKELLAVPDRSTLKGKRDYVILGLLVGCACAGRSWPSSTSRPSSYEKAGGSWSISKGKGGASAPSPSRSGSSRESTPG